MRKVLIACEFSGIVRDAFTNAGYDTTSIDLLPTESPGPHIIMDLLDKKTWDYDLMIAHPPCTYLCNSGVRWFYEDETRWEKLKETAHFFNYLMELPINKIAIENPIPHKYAINLIGRKYDQLIQPWQFGHEETKAICLWLKNIPKLKPTNIVITRNSRVHLEPPSEERWKNRSRFYPKIAKAMAEQWG